MYLDDLRNPKNNGFIIVRSFNEAVQYVQTHGFPSYVSFDHDLGDHAEKTGYDFAKYLVDLDLNGIMKMPDNFDFNVHSANPVGATNIKNYMENYLRYRD